MDNKTPDFKNKISKAPSASIEQEKSPVEQYILETLLFTSQAAVKRKQGAVDIKVYAPEKNQPAMKIFRMVSYCRPLPGDPENLQELAFQDEVNVLTDEGMDTMTRWQINSSIMVDKETLQFDSIREKPERIGDGVFNSLKVFSDLSKEKGAMIYAEDLRFESDGERWVPVSDGRVTALADRKSLLPTKDSLPEKLD